MAVQLNAAGTTTYLRYENGAGSVNQGNGSSSNVAWSMGGWFYIDTDTATHIWMLTALADYTSGGDHLAIVNHNGSPDYWAAYVGAWLDRLESTPNNGFWIYIGVSQSAGIFSNGGYWTGTTTTLSGSDSVSSFTGTYAALADLLIGRWHTGATAYWMRGRVAHVRLWSGSRLTQAEFEAEMVSATAVKTANLYAAYEFADGALLTDSSGNGRTLVNSGTDYAYIAGPIAGGASGAAPSASQRIPAEFSRATILNGLGQVNY